MSGSKPMFTQETRGTNECLWKNKTKGNDFLQDQKNCNWGGKLHGHHNDLAHSCLVESVRVYLAYCHKAITVIPR